jgi:hypothetical protein
MAICVRLLAGKKDGMLDSGVTTTSGPSNELQTVAVAGCTAHDGVGELVSFKAYAITVIAGEKVLKKWRRD